MRTRAQRQRDSIKNTQRRKLIREKQKNEAIKYRKRHYPVALSIIGLGVLLILFRVLFASISSTVSSGEISNKGVCLGPISMKEGALYSLSVDYSLKRTAVWCSLTTLLLDENKNYLTGANKDLYYEKDLEGNVYQESQMMYSVIANKTGDHYYQFIPQHPKYQIPNKKIRYELKHHFLGFNWLLYFGLLVCGIGFSYMWYVFADRELTTFKPKLNSPQSIELFKKCLMFMLPILVLLLLVNLFKMGYADTENAPPSYFGNEGTHYFGK